LRWLNNVNGVYSLQRTNTENSKQIFQEKEWCGHSPNFQIHVSVSNLYIPTIGLSFLLQEICGPIQGLLKSLTDTWMWKLWVKPRNSHKKNTVMEFSLTCLAQVSFLFISQEGLGHIFRYRPFFFPLAGWLCKFYANDRGKWLIQLHSATQAASESTFINAKLYSSCD
jgi:hypothetical protein